MINLLNLLIGQEIVQIYMGLGGYGDDGGLQTIDQIKNPKPKDNQPKKQKPKNENLSENLNKESRFQSIKMINRFNLI